MNPSTFQRHYPGRQVVLDEIVCPVFGGTVTHDEDIIANHGLKNQADAAGIAKITRIAQYPIDGTPFHVFDVEVNDKVNLSRNRLGIKNLLVSKLDVFSSSLMFFHYTDPAKEWRISYVTKGSSNADTTAPKRYTYLCGDDYPCRTVEERFKKLSEVPQKTVKSLEEAFSVEALNKEFYSEVADWYYKLCGVDQAQSKYLHLPHIDFNTVAGKLEYQQFGIRLVGRLLFCWFLKHKYSAAGKPLIPETLLPNIDEKGNLPDDFYHRTLAPLFFGCLNTPMAERSNYCEVSLSTDSNWMSIPFLNGGLFSPQPGDCAENYYRNTLKVDNEHLQKFLRILSRFNFTIDENDPNEMELAIDPEMLGQIFENLLASISPETGSADMRKNTGSYYTPRIIVDYMATQSLLAYLESKTGIGQERLKLLCEDASAELATDDKNKVSKAIFDMTVLDPACGSGAFPMGVLNAALKVLSKVDPDGKYAKTLLGARYQLAGETPRYMHKLALIANSLYGVDIQPFAVEIAKLRVFLSLIVDDTIDDNAVNRGIRALPNLDFKFVAANTLIPLPDLHEVKGGGKTKQAVFDFAESEMVQDDLGFIDEEIQTQDRFFSDFECLADEYFSASCPKDKQKCKDKLEKLIQNKTTENHKHIESLFATMYTNIDRKLSKKDEQKKNFLQREIALLDTYKNIFNHQTVGFFEPRYFFPKIKSGFDIVIGNPPYIQLQGHEGALGSLYENCGYKTFARSGDIYCLFYEQGYNFLKTDAHLCYITSNQWMRTGHGEIMRKFFAENTNPVQLIDFAGKKIFESATVNTNILLFQKSKNSGNTAACIIAKGYRDNLSSFIQQNTEICNFNNKESWVILNPMEQSIKRKIEKIGTPLKDWDIKINYGIKTGCNEAFIIDQTTRDRLIAEDPKNAEIIRPILRGRDIKRYRYDYANLYLIVSHNGVPDKRIPKINIEDFPAVKKYLDIFWSQISSRTDMGDTPYNLRSCAYMDDFSKPKIVWGNLALGASFTHAPANMYINAPSSFITPYSDYLLAIMNSRLADWYIRNIGVARNGGYVEYKPMFIELLPVPKLLTELSILNAIPALKNKNWQIFQDEIDEAIFLLYKLTREEIEYLKTVDFQ